MTQFNSWFLEQTSLMRILILFVVSAGLIIGFIRGFDPAFQAVTAGHQIIDLQQSITPDSIYSELPDYTASSRRIYFWFMVADFIFPASAGLAMALLWAWLVKVAPNSIYRVLMRLPIFALPLLTTLFDWMENVGFLLLVNLYPQELPNVASISCAIRNTKLFVMDINSVVTLALITVTLAVRLYGRFYSADPKRT
jgi:hypothetical protein